jgi:hypothetical protein
LQISDYAKGPRSICNLKSYSAMFYGSVVPSG